MPISTSRRTFIGSAAAAAATLITPGLSGARTPNMMDIDQFVADCVEANSDSDPQMAVKEVLARAVSQPQSVIAALGKPVNAGIHVLHRSPTLTIFNP